jgi:hypothetical protein
METEHMNMKNKNAGRLLRYGYKLVARIIIAWSLLSNKAQTNDSENYEQFKANIYAAYEVLGINANPSDYLELGDTGGCYYENLPFEFNILLCYELPRQVIILNKNHLNSS